MATTTAGERSPNLSYAGPALTPAIAYHWRIAFSDDEGASGAWSTATATFSLAELVTPNAIQDITFSYGANGNVTRIVDLSDTDARKSVSYVYDGLNRLTSASSSRELHSLLDQLHL